MSERRHAVSRVGIGHENPGLFLMWERGAEAPLTFARSIFRFDPLFAQCFLCKLAQVGTELFK